MRISDWSSDVCSSDLLFAVFIASTLVLLEQMRHFDAALLPAFLALGALVLVALLLLIWREKAAADPLLPVALLRDPTTWRSDALAACHGDRTSVVSGKSVSVRVDLGGSRLIKK